MDFGHDNYSKSDARTLLSMCISLSTCVFDSYNGYYFYVKESNLKMIFRRISFIQRGNNILRIIPNIKIKVYTFVIAGHGWTHVLG